MVLNKETETMGTYIYKAPTKGQRKTNLGYVRSMEYWYKPYWSCWGGNPAAKLDALRDRLESDSAGKRILCVLGAFEDGGLVYQRDNIIWHDCDMLGTVVGVLRPNGKRWTVQPPVKRGCRDCGAIITTTEGSKDWVCADCVGIRAGRIRLLGATEPCTGTGCSKDGFIHEPHATRCRDPRCIEMGDEVRSFDFAHNALDDDDPYGRDIDGPRAAYIKGVVHGVLSPWATFTCKTTGEVSGPFHDCPRYIIEATATVRGGDEMVLPRTHYFPPINDTPSSSGRTLTGVERTFNR